MFPWHRIAKLFCCANPFFRLLSSLEVQNMQNHLNNERMAKGCKWWDFCWKLFFLQFCLDEEIKFRLKAFISLCSHPGRRQFVIMLIRIPAFPLLSARARFIVLNVHWNFPPKLVLAVLSLSAPRQTYSSSFSYWTGCHSIINLRQFLIEWKRKAGENFL